MQKRAQTHPLARGRPQRHETVILVKVAQLHLREHALVRLLVLLGGLVKLLALLLGLLLGLLALLFGNALGLLALFFGVQLGLLARLVGLLACLVGQLFGFLALFFQLFGCGGRESEPFLHIKSGKAYLFPSLPWSA